MNLAIITYLWSPDKRSKLTSAYTPDDVRRLQRAVARNLTVPHSFACITDYPEAFDGDSNVKGIRLDATIPMNAGHCVCRLMTFHPDGREIFGADTVFQMDLDTFVVGNMDEIVSRKETAVFWRNPARAPWDRPKKSRPLYNGSFVLHRCGTASQVWSEYQNWHADLPQDPVLKDDQTWYSHAFGSTAPYWDQSHGIYRIARPGEPETGVWGDLPANAKLVTTPGSEGKPSNPVVMAANPWLEFAICSMH